MRNIKNEKYSILEIKIESLIIEYIRHFLLENNYSHLDVNYISSDVISICDVYIGLEDVIYCVNNNISLDELLDFNWIEQEKLCDDENYIPKTIADKYRTICK